MTVCTCKTHLKEALIKEGEYIQKDLLWRHDNKYTVPQKITISINPSPCTCEFCKQQGEYTIWNDIWNADQPKS